MNDEESARSASHIEVVARALLNRFRFLDPVVSLVNTSPNGSVSVKLLSRDERLLLEFVLQPVGFPIAELGPFTLKGKLPWRCRRHLAAPTVLGTLQTHPVFFAKKGWCYSKRTLSFKGYVRETNRDPHAFPFTAYVQIYED